MLARLLRLLWRHPAPLAIAGVLVVGLFPGAAVIGIPIVLVVVARLTLAAWWRL